MTLDNSSSLIERRKTFTEQKITAFRESLLEHIPKNERDELFGDHTCIYAVGSVGRMEMSAHSDLDLFLVRTPNRDASRIDEVRLQSAIVRVLGELKLPKPSNDAIFLRMHTSTDFVERLGEPRDDTENTFTARMLLVLESKPIIGEVVYDAVIQSAISAYWTNLQYHPDDYLPFCLANDIVRYWRNLLLNYEHKTARKQRELDRKRDTLSNEVFLAEQQKLDADKWLRSCKLRYVRCLTCYGTIAWLLGEAGKTGNITQEVFLGATKMTPLERLGTASVAGGQDTHAKYLELERAYATFLEATDMVKTDLLTQFANRGFRRTMMDAAESFGNRLFDVLQILGHDQRLYRYIVI